MTQTLLNAIKKSNKTRKKAEAKQKERYVRRKESKQRKENEKEYLSNFQTNLVKNLLNTINTEELWVIIKSLMLTM